MWLTLEAAQRYAADTNSQTGITDDDWRAILASSIAAGPTPQDRCSP